MGSFRINRADQTFVARDLAELKLWAASGKVYVDDLVQAQDSTQWQYAAEVRELSGLVKHRSPASMTLDLPAPASRGGSPGVRRAVIGLSAVGIAVAFAVTLKVFFNPPSPEQLLITGPGTYAVKDREGLLTEAATLRGEPQDGAASVASLQKDERVNLVRKSGDWYEISTRSDQKGWIRTGQLAPGYLFTEEAHARLDPIFNPERYLLLASHTWEVAEGRQRGAERKTIFTFEINNSTDYWMDQAVVRITFLDKDGREVATRDVQVADALPPRGRAFIENVEVMVDISEVPNARVRIIGARALEGPPPGVTDTGAPAPSGDAPAVSGAPVGEVVMGEPGNG